MSYGNDYYADDFAYDSREAIAEERANFIRRTYAHLALAILAFASLLALFWQIEPLKEFITRTMLMSRFGWILAIIAFAVVGTIADKWASSSHSRGMQYAGLGLYVVAEAFIVMPLLIIAQIFTGSLEIVPTAGLLTLAIFGGLTLTVLITRKDFSFLRAGLSMAGFIILGVIIAGFFLPIGFNFMLFFIGFVILVMCGWILYYTSQVLHKYNTDQYVGASLALFAAIATLFYYILYFLIMLSGRE